MDDMPQNKRKNSQNSNNFGQIVSAIILTIGTIVAALIALQAAHVIEFQLNLGDYLSTQNPDNPNAVAPTITSVELEASPITIVSTPIESSPTPLEVQASPTNVVTIAIESSPTPIVITSTPIQPQTIGANTEDTCSELQSDTIYELQANSIVLGDVIVNGTTQYDESQADALQGYPEGTVTLFRTSGTAETLSGSGASLCTFEGQSQFYEFIEEQFDTGCRTGCESVRIVIVEANNVDVSYAVQVLSSSEDGTSYQCTANTTYTVTIIGGAYNTFGREDTAYWRTRLYIFNGEVQLGSNREPSGEYYVGHMENAGGDSYEAAESSALDDSITLVCSNTENLKLVTVDTAGSYGNMNYGAVTVLVSHEEQVPTTTMPVADTLTIIGSSSIGTTWTAPQTGMYEFSIVSGAYCQESGSPTQPSCLPTIWVFRNEAQIWNAQSLVQDNALLRLGVVGNCESGRIDYCNTIEEAEAIGRNSGELFSYLNKDDVLTLLAVDNLNAYGDNPGAVVIGIRFAQ